MAWGVGSRVWGAWFAFKILLWRGLQKVEPPVRRIEGEGMGEWIRNYYMDRIKDYLGTTIGIPPEEEEKAYSMKRTILPLGNPRL